ncbi:uncharacterized protein TNCV_2032431 [Trichonephila clavipes]|nr:uncharacterized protein TNCV_2032431 [Trichonephila clavipes]
MKEGRFVLVTVLPFRTNAGTLPIMPKRSSSRDVGTNSYRYHTAPLYFTDQMPGNGNTFTPPSYKSPDNARSFAFAQRSSSPLLIEDETFNDSDIINNLMDYEDGQEEDYLRADKNMQGSSFPTNWKSIVLK